MRQPRNCPGTLKVVCLRSKALFCLKMKGLRRNWDVWLSSGQIKTTKHIRKDKKVGSLFKGRKWLHLKREDGCRSGLQKYNMMSDGNRPSLRQIICPRAEWSRDVIWEVATWVLLRNMVEVHAAYSRANGEGRID